ncbi:MAG: L-seryl-tRNA(Sec) selenium transferase [Thermodesulfovibrionia bacterium]|nr:L-seryl-tRNA(Sec) selenium transferase [Thermodesulfovibrionia bacterium]
MNKPNPLKDIPSVDECLKSSYGLKWLDSYPRKSVLKAVRNILDLKRKEILSGLTPVLSLDALSPDIERVLKELSAYKLRPVINATGVVIHTNLGRAILSDEAIKNITNVAASYSNLEYDLSSAKRGKRYSHLNDIVLELTGAEDAIVVNNNAAAVLVCLNTFARGREVVVSRGELVEIGGSFRIPEVMEASGAVLREVGSTNKAHLRDYENAVCGDTALLLKVHPSNYKVIGFTEEVSMEELAGLGREFRVPVMADLGSGCMIDLEKYGVYGEPTVQSVIKSGVDIVTFSGDKLLGGPQAGIIIGKKKYIQMIQKNPMLRALRIDKLTLASLEATFMQFLDEEKAVRDIPTLRMLTEKKDIIKKRAQKILTSLKKPLSDHADITIISDQSRAGGGSLPETDFPTFVVSIKPLKMSVNKFEKKLRESTTPVIARIQDGALLVDARTVLDREIKSLVSCIVSALS